MRDVVLDPFVWFDRGGSHGDLRTVHLVQKVGNVLSNDPAFWQFVWERGVPALLCIGTIVAVLVFAKKAG